uniref:Uncharacterized protein n=1 Tax=Phaseolus vulgaris TaxID=3885 RepID=V7B499_PHAVU|nr:hypothetical protein PHAVU_008G109500g [Phaseolus vulgaris]ESW12405.1 hypothetical protein PHAVU_008G109500g [Phaseolus vulgaris]
MQLEFNMWNSIQQHYINYSDFSVFKYLKKLFLLDGNIVGCVGGEGFKWPTNLQEAEFKQSEQHYSFISE